MKMSESGLIQNKVVSIHSAFEDTDPGQVQQKVYTRLTKKVSANEEISPMSDHSDPEDEDEDEDEDDEDYEDEDDEDEDGKAEELAVDFASLTPADASESPRSGETMKNVRDLSFL